MRCRRRVFANCAAILSLSVLGYHCSCARDDSNQEAEQLNAQVAELFGRERYEEAIPLAERVLAIREKTAGPMRPDTAIALNNLAQLYKSTRAFAKAEPLYLRALAICENSAGPESPETATVLSGLGALYNDSGALAKAEPLLLRALAIREKALGPGDLSTALSLTNLAVHYEDTGAYAKAEPLHQRALAIREAALGPEHPDTVMSVNLLAGIYRDMGDYAKAAALSERVLRTREKTLGADDPDTGVALNNLALIHMDAGAYAKAVQFAERALTIFEKGLGPDDKVTATGLNTLAILYQTTGAYAKAEPLYLRVVAIREKQLGAGHPATAVAINNLAQLYEQTGAAAKAEPLLVRALANQEKALGPEHPYTATAAANLAEHYRLTGEYAKAEPLLLRALAIREKALGAEHPAMVDSLNGLALLYEASGAYAKAEPLAQRALAISERTLGPEHPTTARSLNNLADLYGETGAYAKAIPLMSRAVALREKTLGAEHPRTAASLADLGMLYAITGDDAKAELLSERAQAIEEGNTSRFLFSGSEARKRAYVQQMAGHVNVNVTISLKIATPRSAVLGLTSVLQYKGRVLDAMSNSAVRLRRSVAAEDQALFEQLSQNAQALSTITFSEPSGISSEAYRRRVDALAQQQEKLESQLSVRSAALRQVFTPITFERVREALPSDAVLIECFRYQPLNPISKEAPGIWGPTHYVAYVVRHTGNPIAIDLGAAKPIEDLVAEFRGALADPTSTYFRSVARDLSELLIRPLSPYLRPKQRVLLSPDGALNLVPFAALVDENGEYLVQRFELDYVTSGRDLLRMSVTSPAQGRAVVLANPNFGKGGTDSVDARPKATRSVDFDRGGIVFAPLAGTESEAKLLQSLLKLSAADVFTQDRATEANLRQLHGPGILHVATHGFFLTDQQLNMLTTPELGSDHGLIPGENPLLRSGLALAGANARRSGAADDGILTAAEAAQLDLVGTQLVVLSACETGLGSVQTGEGVYGLRRALVLAGAQAQLVSLWKVADSATQDLIVHYYRSLLAGEGRAQALRNSQRAMLADSQLNHPYYWAAFIPIGQWTPLTSGSQ